MTNVLCCEEIWSWGTKRNLTNKKALLKKKKHEVLKLLVVVSKETLVQKLIKAPYWHPKSDLSIQQTKTSQYDEFNEQGHNNVTFPHTREVTAQLRRLWIVNVLCIKLPKTRSMSHDFRKETSCWFHKMCVLALGAPQAECRPVPIYSEKANISMVGISKKLFTWINSTTDFGVNCPFKII